MNRNQWLAALTATAYVGVITCAVAMIWLY